MPPVSVSAQGFHLLYQKLYSSGGDLNSRLLGGSVDINDRFLVAGEPENPGGNLLAGAVRVFDARTGRLLRLMTAQDATDFDRLGESVAISGSWVIAGAPNADGGGAAYVFDARNGRQRVKLVAPPGANGTSFGTSVAIQGHLAVVGAPGKDIGAGAAYLFDARSGTLLAEWQASVRGQGDQFGFSVALCGGWGLVGAYGASGGDASSGNAYLFAVKDAGGAVVAEARQLFSNESFSDDLFGVSVGLDGRHAVVGAPGRDESGVDRGAAYVFDILSGDQVAKLVPSDLGAGHGLGGAVAISGSRILVSTDQVNGVYLFDLASGSGQLSEAAKLRPIDVPVAFISFGKSLAIHGTRAVIGAPGDNVAAPGAGALYLVGDLVGSLPMTPVARRLGVAPGAVDASFSSFRDVLINPDGETTLRAGLLGPGSNRGRATGGWSETIPSPFGSPLEGFAVAGQNLQFVGLPGVSIAGVGGVVSNHSHVGFALATLRGVGVTPRDREAIGAFGSGPFAPMLRTGPTLAFGGAGAEEILRFLEMAQARQSGHLAVAYQMRIGTGAIFSGNDTGILSLDPNGSVFGTDMGEGRVIPPGGLDVFGQFFGRVSQSRGTTARGFGAFVVSGLDGSTRQQLFVDDLLSDPVGGPGQGDAAPGAVGGAGPATVRGFLGETVDGGDFLVWRATLIGPGLPGPLREGIWSESGGGAKVVQRGEILDPVNEPGVKATRILGFWTSESSDVFLLLKLAGPGVTAANDCAFYCWDATTGALTRLLREGDDVGGGDGARVGVIQRVTVGDGGRYLIACSLTGVSATTNQALLAGDGLQTEPALRLPYVALRKGVKYSSGLNAITAIRSLTFLPNNDRTGAGGKGLGQAVNAAGEAALTVTFDNRAIEVMKGEL